ncbi:MAG: hypothetical protein LBU43_01715 [Candidatus Accumulibacter sp.]|jgi:virulence-associated protein VapD|nr:hypothetical protein [Accumulibacter sp.]
MKSYTLSLSRWHKVAERLARIYAELTQNAKDTFNNTQISGYLGESKVDRLRELSKIQIANLQRAFRVQDALAHIRQAVGEGNAKTGVAKELADYDALSRRHKLLESILTAQDGEMVTFEEMRQLPSQIVTEDRYDRGKAGVRVRMFDAQSFAALRAEADGLRTRIYALTDRISDLNRERLTLELQEKIAQEAGL